jgi:hypothetical protein
LTENYTSGVRLQIRFNSLPKPGELDEFDLRRFRIGEIYDVPTRLASVLIIAGYAEMVNTTPTRAEAAEYNRGPRAKPKRKSRIPNPK